MNREEVTLAVPALPEYVRLARLTAAFEAASVGRRDDLSKLYNKKHSRKIARAQL